MSRNCLIRSEIENLDSPQVDISFPCGTLNGLKLANVWDGMKVRGGIKKRRYVPDLVEAMADCDANYIRLMKLFAWDIVEAKIAFAVAIETSDQTLIEIAVRERCPYTTMLDLKVTNDADKPWIKWPSMEIRVYHDVCSAEVVSFERHKRLKYRYDYPNPEMYLPDEKSQINKYLGELLTFCIDNGHSLVEVAATSDNRIEVSK